MERGIGPEPSAVDSRLRLRDIDGQPMPSQPNLELLEIAQAAQQRLLQRMLSPLDHTPPSASRPPTEPREGTTTLVDERYRFEHKIGSGGMGEVWRATQVRLQRTVAIKLIRPDLNLDERTRQRFHKEARISARISHPNVVEVLDVGELPSGVPYLVMEFLTGETLSELLRRAGRLTWPRARNLLEQIIAAMQCSHAHGIIHRDLKPANIFAQHTADGREHCKVIDFGLAKSLAEHGALDISETSSLAGTPSSMSPEQIRGAKVDARSDVYAVGCLAYRLLTGQRPFAGPNHEQMLLQHLHSPPPRLGEILGHEGAANGIEQWVHRAMAKRPDDRFENMAAMLAALLDIRPGETAQTAAPSVRTEDLQPKLDRTSRITWAVGALALTLIAGIFLSVGRSRTASPEREPPTGQNPVQASGAPRPAPPQATHERMQSNTTSGASNQVKSSPATTLPPPGHGQAPKKAVTRAPAKYRRRASTRPRKPRVRPTSTERVPVQPRPPAPSDAPELDAELINPFTQPP